MALLTFLVVTAVAVARLGNLFAAVMLFGIYSLLSAALFVVLHAVDVAFTEAAVGAGVSTILMLGTLALTSARQEPRRDRHRRAPLALLVAVITGLTLAWGIGDRPPFGDSRAPANLHVAPQYIHEAPVRTGVPNMVTAVLASYRGYDTLGETTVIFAAGIGVLALLGRRRTDGAAEPAERG